MSALNRAGVPTDPLDPDELSDPQRYVLPLWAEHHFRKRKEAQDEASSKSTKKGLGVARE